MGWDVGDGMVSVVCGVVMCVRVCLDRVGRVWLSDTNMLTTTHSTLTAITIPSHTHMSYHNTQSVHNHDCPAHKQCDMTQYKPGSRFDVRSCAICACLPSDTFVKLRTANEYELKEKDSKQTNKTNLNAFHSGYCPCKLSTADAPHLPFHHPPTHTTHATHAQSEEKAKSIFFLY